jgi:predicted dehydrogenase
MDANQRDVVRVGLIGTGFGVAAHLPAFAQYDGVEVVAVCSADPRRAESAARALGVEIATGDYRELISHPDVDLVDITTPPALHTEMTMAALAAGKHVLCEKPFAMSAAETEKMRDAASASGLVTALCHEFRYDPVRRALRKLVSSGYVGDVKLVDLRVHMGQGTNPRIEPYYWGWLAQADRGGGFAMNHLSHHLDLLLWTFGSLASWQSRSSTIITKRPRLVGEYRDGDPLGPDTATDGVGEVDADDTVLLFGEFASGAMLSVSGSWSLHFPPGQQLFIYGTEGTLAYRSDMAIGGELSGARVGDAGMSPIDVTEFDLTGSTERHRFAPHIAALTTELVGQIQGETSAEPLYATFEDGHRVQQLLDDLRVVTPALTPVETESRSR